MKTKIPPTWIFCLIGKVPKLYGIHWLTQFLSDDTDVDPDYELDSGLIDEEDLAYEGEAPLPHTIAPPAPYVNQCSVSDIQELSHPKHVVCPIRVMREKDGKSAVVWLRTAMLSYLFPPPYLSLSLVHLEQD
ncbi:hypothetical protein J6590_096249 [Homalodisca vitripennis]|nr:hypothetical protein J6590_096249 [Homalodisca vitripennis]